jgi:hypothetical protein
MGFLEYPVTRQFQIRYLTPILIILGTVHITFMTLINVAAVGYEVTPLISTSFNETTTLWYERFSSQSWLPQSRECAGSTIMAIEGITLRQNYRC